MSEHFFFGDEPRSLFGLLHTRSPSLRLDPGARNEALLVCPPLLQDAMRSHRALWQLAEQLSDNGVDVLRFDWFGTGDSGGDCGEVTLDGLVDDLATASSLLSSMIGASRIRMLGLRSSALPVLAYAQGVDLPLDLVLWEPWLDGRQVVEMWRGQQVEQLTVAGRYPYGAPAGEADELMGFTVSDALLDPLRGVDASAISLAPGSRVLLAGWTRSPALERFLSAQAAAGVAVERIELDPSDAPVFDQPRLFEAQAFPRRSVSLLAEAILDGGRA